MFRVLVWCDPLMFVLYQVWSAETTTLAVALEALAHAEVWGHIPRAVRVCLDHMTE